MAEVGSIAEARAPVLIVPRNIPVEQQPGILAFWFEKDNRQFAVRAVVRGPDSDHVAIEFRVFEGEVPHVLVEATSQILGGGQNVSVTSSRNLQRGIHRDAKSAQYQPRIVGSMIKEVVVRHYLGIQTWYSDTERSVAADLMYEGFKDDPLLHVEDPSADNG